MSQLINPQKPPPLPPVVPKGPPPLPQVTRTVSFNGVRLTHQQVRALEQLSTYDKTGVAVFGY